MRCGGARRLNREGGESGKRVGADRDPFGQHHVSSHPSSEEVKRSEHGAFTLLLKIQRQSPLWPAARIRTLQNLIAANRPLRNAAFPRISEGEVGPRAFQSGWCTSSSVVPSAASTGLGECLHALNREGREGGEKMSGSEDERRCRGFPRLRYERRRVGTQRQRGLL